MPLQPEVSGEGLADLINAEVEELGGIATPTRSFDDMDLDSLALVEIAVLLSDTYQVSLTEYDVAEAGNLVGLSRMIGERAGGVAP